VKNQPLLRQLIRELCAIPAPSGQEQQRAAYLKAWLERHGAEGVYIDEALNVIWPVGVTEDNDMTVFMAHTDTVFPDLDPLPFREEAGRYWCPGVTDDTAQLAVLLISALYYLERKPKHGLLFVANSCEEGLGNLKGTRKLFEDYAGRVKKFVSFDSSIHKINDRCVGSHRYEVEVLTKGGHSYTAFGNKNAIAALADMIHDLYAIELPVREGSRVTMNVGIVEGGTSVNTIAQSAKMLCEYRSDNADCIDIMKEKFHEIFEKAKTDEVKVNVTPVGERPCARGVSEDDLKALIADCAAVIEEVDGRAPIYASGSTDCNIPLSLGIPAVCIGVYYGGGSHTREEWVEKKSMVPGLEIAIKVAAKLNENA
jgi:acetylornithine deacetylase/succinyl-diaminopimelate desuccinylase-like protein